MAANTLDRQRHKLNNVQAEKPVGVRFLDLKHGQCKFPLGAERDRPEMFCGEVVVAGKPYCAGHCAVCYAKATRRL